MSSPDIAAGDGLWRLARAASFGWTQFWALNPPGVLATTLLPRAVLQGLFFTLLGRYVGGAEHARFVLVGAPAITLPLLCTISIADLVMVEKWSGTFWQIRRGRLHPFVTLALRVWPYAAVGLVTSLVATLAAGLAVGLGELRPHSAALLGIYALMAVSMCATGLAGAAFAIGRRADVVVSNLLSYLIILAGGAFLPTDRLGPLRPLAWLLPSGHGLAAARAVIDGRPWLGQVALEAAVGGGWLAAAAVLVTVQVHRARRHGHDDFA